MSVWNDCPICNEPLEFDGRGLKTKIFYCSSGERHYEVYEGATKDSIEEDYIFAENYWIVRDDVGTVIHFRNEALYLDSIWLSIDECLNEEKLKIYMLLQ